MILFWIDIAVTFNSPFRIYVPMLRRRVPEERRSVSARAQSDARLYVLSCATAVRKLCPLRALLRTQVLVTNRYRIAMLYFRSWFLIDVLAALPCAGP